MESFLGFLQRAKTALININSYKTVHLVLGNESCDLDSTVSALALSYFLHSQESVANQHHVVLPIMNVDSKSFLLRTEISYLLKQTGIDSTLLIYKDQIDLVEILKSGNIKTTLVDHHVLTQSDHILYETVVGIYDHRPINSKEIVNNKGIINKKIEVVGSCATLIAREIFNNKQHVLFKELSFLLYATIIFDTIGLNRDHGRTFDKDIEIGQQLESLLNLSESRQDLFDSLWKVHNDTSTLSTKDLLYRDLKVVQGVPIAGLCLLAEDYLKRDDSISAISSFAESYKYGVVLVGINAIDGVRRDIAIYSTDAIFRKILIEILVNAPGTHGADLMLTEVSTKHKDVVCFQQGNVKLTRKFILPLVNEALLEMLHR